MIVRVRDQNAHGVRLVSPTAPSFDEIARPLIGERVADLVLALKPMLVIVSNESEQAIASFSIVWTTRYEDGRTHADWTHASFPAFVTGLLSAQDDEGISAGARRIEAKGIVVHGYGDLDPYFDQFIDQFDPRKRDGLDGAREVEIDLNAVIFEDGTLIGPDNRSQLRELFSTYVRVQQEWLRGIREALDAGEPVANAFQALDRFQRDLRESPGALLPYGKDPAHFWRVQASADVVRWRKQHDDADIPALIRGLNLGPFVIRPS